MSQAPMLTLPNFTLSFTLEIDASRSGIGVVMDYMMPGSGLALFSRKKLMSIHRML
jgi:hypothetical protein